MLYFATSTVCVHACRPSTKPTHLYSPTPASVYYRVSGYSYIYRARPRTKCTQQGRAKFGGITAHSVLTLGEIPEEGGTGEKRRVWKKIPLMKNYGITLIRRNYGTSGRQKNLSDFLNNIKLIYKLNYYDNKSAQKTVLKS